MHCIRNPHLAWLLLLCAYAAELPAADARPVPLPEDVSYWRVLNDATSDDVLQRFHHTIDELLGKVDGDPLLTDHFRSIKIMIDAENLMRTAPEDGKPADRLSWLISFCRYFLFIYARPGDGDNSKALEYARTNGRFFHAFRSRVDNQLSYVWIFTPDGYWGQRQHKTAPYPLILDLHGACGDWEPVWDSFHLGWPPPLRGKSGNNDNGTFQHFTLLPWGRGGFGGLGGESDTWQSTDWACRTFPIDADRRYIRGTSMGGGATWHLATQTPGYWAAVACVVGTFGDEWFYPWLINNIKETPLLMVNGDRDSNVNSPYPAYKALEAAGANVQLVLEPESGHSTMCPVIDAWLGSHVRQRPKTFSFTADGPWYPGRNGIAMHWCPDLSGFPHFTCRIEGQRVYIDSEGTSGLQIELGQGGLGMTGEVSVVWNGHPAVKKTVPPLPSDSSSGNGADQLSLGTGPGGGWAFQLLEHGR